MSDQNQFFDEGEFEVYRKRQDVEYISDFDREIKHIEGKKR